MTEEPLHKPVDNPVSDAAGFGMTDLEEKLRAPGGEELAAALLAQFSALDAAFSARIAAGLSPDDFAHATVIRNSLAAASNLLIRIPKGKP